MFCSNQKILSTKRCAAIAIVFLLIFQIIFYCLVQASAATDYVVVAAADGTVVRSGAGSGNNHIGTASLGSVYDYITEAKDSGGTTWYKIQYSESKVGWISSASSAKTARAQDYTQAVINRIASSYGAVGAQVAVIENGEVTATYNYGYATKATTPMNSDHKIRVASISKVAVAINAMKMQEQGLVDINANIGAYWGASPYKAVTLKSLLSHTSTLKALSYSSTKSGTLSQLTSSGSYSSGTVGSSSVWMYNNYAVGVAGSTLELASGQTLNSYAKTNVFAPLGMDASFSSGLLNNTSMLATLYHSTGNVARSISTAAGLKGSTVPGGNCSTFAGGLTCSAKDLAKLMAMLANDGTYNGVQILTPTSVTAIESRLFTKTEYGGSFSQCMPLRFKAGLYGESELYYHTGNAYGVLALASYNPSTKDGVVVLTTGMSDTNTTPACSRDAQGIYEICGRISEYVYKYRQPAATTTVTTTTTTTTAPTAATTAVPAVPAQSIAINEQNTVLSLGESVQLSCTVSPSDADDTLVWSAQGKSVSVDSNGKVTAVGYGSGTITVRGCNTSASCTVTVQPDISLNMLGASIRVSDPYGIRFGIQLDKNEFYSTADIVEYGTLMIGAGTLGDAELTLDTPSIRRIKADNILSEDSKKIVYTGVLINIPTSFFDTNVTARGYLIYNDADGNECVVYTDTATKSFRGVAQAAYDKYSAIAEPTVSQRATIEILAEIIGQEQ